MQTSPAAALDSWRRQALPLPLAVAAALLLAVSVALLGLDLLPARKPPPPPPPLRITLAAPPAITPPAPAPPPPPPVAAAPEPLPLPPAPAVPVVLPTPVKPLARPRPVEPVHHRAPPHRLIRRPDRETPPVTAPQPDIAPIQQTTPAPAAPAAPIQAARDTLQGRIRQAIKAAFQYPEAARDMGEHGSVLVAFLYRDRSVSGVHVIRSSGSSSLDRAAVAIVSDASMPAPGKLAGQTLSLEVPVVFDLSDGDE